ncbi:hypothetical protein ACFO1S_16150 [Cohnella boryungensis]|uniref:Uncharacterized protein n=1 Tax=Cohnella boryungensis TaxID=768479 RepID=A0ABV8SF11_9BACL
MTATDRDWKNGDAGYRVSVFCLHDQIGWMTSSVAYLQSGKTLR